MCKEPSVSRAQAASALRSQCPNSGLGAPTSHSHAASRCSYISTVIAHGRSFRNSGNARSGGRTTVGAPQQPASASLFRKGEAPHVRFFWLRFQAAMLARTRACTRACRPGNSPSRNRSSNHTKSGARRSDCGGRQAGRRRVGAVGEAAGRAQLAEQGQGSAGGTPPPHRLHHPPSHPPVRKSRAARACASLPSGAPH